ncbi:MNNG and nitrosoguanidine resistance protein [Phlyctema vagabunda]|uniref:MNNG and nitrosoguanidine resistance protein n=1 Tax=Phlyctema vagabunda TaxID=108571 RepID=A0ABR4PRN1_9HELO
MVRDSDEETLGPGSSNGSQYARPDGGETGEKKRHEPQDNRPVGFWDGELKATRHVVFKKWIITTSILCIFVLAVLSLYWGILFRVQQNMSALVVYVVDFDGQVAPYTDVTPLVGPEIVKAAEMSLKPTGELGWGSLPASDFDFDPMRVREAVYDEKAWAAIIINPNATALLRAAVQNGNTSYDPNGAMQVVYVQARHETTHSNYVIPALDKFQTMVKTTFGKTWTAQVLEQASRNSTFLSNIQAAPQALSPGIGFSTYNLRPFFPAVATPAVSVGLIYLIIISYFSFSFYLPIHMRFIEPDGHRPMKFFELIIWRWCATVMSYFFLSFCFSVISLAYQIPFSTGSRPHTVVANPATAYGKGTFPVYWMLNWVGMLALGLACENMSMVLGQPWMVFWLIFWVISNVSTAFYAITLAPGFYRWGLAWPLHNIVLATRTLLFDIHSQVGLNFGILFAWVAIHTVLFPVCCWIMRWKSMREKRNKQS